VIESQESLRDFDEDDGFDEWKDEDNFDEDDDW